MANCIGLIGIILSVLFARYIDRRVIVLFGVIGCGLSQLLPAIGATAIDDTAKSASITVAFITIFTFCYSAYSKSTSFRCAVGILTCCTAPFGWLLGGEYVNNRLRATTFGFATAIDYLLTWVGTFTAPYFINPAKLNWGSKYGYIWFGSNMIMAVYAYLYLPETRDRTLEELHEMFEAGVPARKFKDFVSTHTQTVAAEAEVIVQQKEAELTAFTHKE